MDTSTKTYRMGRIFYEDTEHCGNFDDAPEVVAQTKTTLVWRKQCAGYYLTTDGRWAAEMEAAQLLRDRGFDPEDCKDRWQLARIGDVTYHNDVRDTYSTLGESKAAAQAYSDREARVAVIAAEHAASKAAAA